jgi:hypothetical protein
MTIATVTVTRRETIRMNILKKPIMSLYDRVQMKSEKRPVCIVGMPRKCRPVTSKQEV